MTKILIIDDDTTICSILADFADKMGCEASVASTLEKGMHLAFADRYDLIFLDMQFPEGSALQILPELLNAPSEPEIIIITGFGIHGAELAFKYGAWGYLEKPLILSELSLQLSRVLQYRQEKISTKPPVELKRSGIIGESPAISRCLDAVRRASATDASVLISGETGTGKELFANAIHENSKRSANPFIVVDCGALPETLVEGILFGHEKGAFTGADMRRKGLLEQANGGTLFLDEIAELPLNMQKAFLRVLQERRVRPLGANREVSVDFRLVAATNHDLQEMAEKSLFREDLLFRIRAIEIQLPPLRNRREDIREIAVHIVHRLCQQYNIGIKRISQEFFDVLYSQTWPGNVRELINVLEYSLAAAVQDPTLVPKHVPYEYRLTMLKDDAVDANKESSVAMDSIEASGDALPSLSEYRDICEKRYLNLLLERAQGDREKALGLSGMSQSQLYALLKKHHLSGFRP